MGYTKNEAERDRDKDALGIEKGLLVNEGDK